MSTPILTDENGKPFHKPERADFDDVTSYLRACWAYNDAVTNAGNTAFAEAFRRALSGAPTRDSH